MAQFLKFDFNENLLRNHFFLGNDSNNRRVLMLSNKICMKYVPTILIRGENISSKICLTIDVTTWMMHWFYIVTLLYKNYSHKSLSNVGKLISNTNHYILISLKIRSVAENKCKKRKYASKLQHLNDIIILIYMQFETFSKRIIFVTNH